MTKLFSFKVQPSSVKRANHARMNEYVLQRMSGTPVDEQRICLWHLR